MILIINFMKLLLENENIKISYFALYNILTGNKHLSPKARRNTVKNYNKNLKPKKENNVKLNDVELNYIAETNLRIERLFNTLLGRLPVLLRPAGMAL